MKEIIPIDKLHSPLSLDGGNSSVDILGNNITTVHQAASHVLPVSGITLGHHAGRLKHGIGDLGHRQLLMVGLGSRDNRGIGREHEMDARVRHKVGLELSDVDVDGAIEPEGGGQGRNDLRDETVQVGVGRSLDVEGSPADVIDGFIVQQDSNVGVLQERVGGEDAVVGFNNGG